jgi:ABC-type branched-subunit amino acid transport system ATPase component
VAEDGLDVKDLTVRFGGITAVDNVSLQARPGEVTSLIGPNGAGKTTTFNACAGLNRPAAGRITLAGVDVTTASPQVHAQLGLGRTFQRMELFDSLTVSENISLGRESLLAGRRVWRHAFAPRTDRADIATATAEAIEICGLTHVAQRSAGSLSTGQRRLVELARAVASGFPLLLLDEPSSGLDHHETDEFGGILLALVSLKGVGILLVEHDMRLVMEISQHLYVLDFGRMIFQGDPADAQSSDVVRKAYLGASP